MDTKAIIDLEQNYILQTYGRPDFVLERGDGVHLFDTDGNQYLDFVSGLSVNALGYNNPIIGDAMAAQAKKLIHVSNLYHTIPAPRLAKLLCERSFADRVFFCNSGTESWEAALKFARKWGYRNFGDRAKHKFIAMNNSFHGRTMGVGFHDRPAEVPQGLRTHVARNLVCGIQQSRIGGAARGRGDGGGTSWNPCRRRAASMRRIRNSSKGFGSCATR